MTDGLEFRHAVKGDAPLILDFIKKLASYEHLEAEVAATPELLDEWIFEKKKAEVVFAVRDGREIGFALYFTNFSTFLGRAGLYLEDLFVLPEYRGTGVGKGLLSELARIALENGYGRFEWACLDWNKPAIDFYKAQGAVSMDEWTVYRLAGKALEKMGNSAE